MPIRDGEVLTFGTAQLTFTSRMFLPLLRRAMVLIDLRFLSNSSVASVVNLRRRG